MVGTGRDFWHNEAQETAVNGCDLLGGKDRKKREPTELKKKQKKTNEHKIHKRGDKS